MTLRRALQTGLALLGLATAASIRWAPATSQAAGATKAERRAEPPADPAAVESSTDPAGDVDPAATEPAEAPGDDAAPQAVAAPPADPVERARWLGRELDATLAAHPRLTTARVGAQVFDLAAATPLWRHHDALAMSLASTAKLFTSAAALQALGPGFVWRTALYGEEASGAPSAAHHDDVLETLYLRGRGDPTLDVAALRTLAIDLADRGVRRVTKQVVIDATFFDDDTEPPHFGEQPKENAAFRAPLSAVSVNRNSVTVIVTASPRGQRPVVRLDPPVTGYFKIVADQLVLTPDGKTRIRVVPVTKKDTVELKLSGQLNVDGPAYYRRIRIDDPVRFAAAALRQALAEQGIRTPNRVSAGAVPPTADLLVAFDSPPLAEVVRRMNKTSDNFIAETVFKTLGAQQRADAGPATWSDGATALRRYVESLALPGPLRLDNGSGLFDASSVSAAQLVAVLRASHHDFHIAPDFLASLPIGGVDGTLQSRFGKRAAAGLVRAKTGTLASVSTLAGYVGSDSAHLIAFAVLINDLRPEQRREARALQEDLVEVLAIYLGASAPGAPAP